MEDKPAEETEKEQDWKKSQQRVLSRKPPEGHSRREKASEKPR